MGKICEDRGKELQLEVDKKVIACIAKLGLQQLETSASDLEAFARYTYLMFLLTPSLNVSAYIYPVWRLMSF